MKESIIYELYEDAVSRAELIMPEGIRYQTCCEKKKKRSSSSKKRFQLTRENSSKNS